MFKVCSFKVGNTIGENWRLSPCTHHERHLWETSGQGI